MSRKKKKSPRRPHRRAPASPRGKGPKAPTPGWPGWAAPLLALLAIAALVVFAAVLGRGWFATDLPSAAREATESANQVADANRVGSKERLPQDDPSSANEGAQSPDSPPSDPESNATLESSGDAPEISDVTMTDEELERTLRQEQLEEASRLVQIYPEDQNAAYLLGLIHQEQGKPDEALVHWERCRRLNPSRADLYDSFGQAYVMQGNLDRAIEMFRKALELQPDRFSVRVRLANTLMRQGKMLEVIASLEDHLPWGLANSPTTDPSRPVSSDATTDAHASVNTVETERAYLLVGQAYQQQKDYELAKSAFTKALEILPDSSEAHYGLARVCAARKELDQAREHQEQFRQLQQQQQAKGRDLRRDYNPLQVTRRSVAHTHSDLGRVYRQQGNSKEAERLWLRAATVEPQDVTSRLQLAELYQSSRKYAEAARIYEELIDLEPTAGVHYFHLGNMSLLLKQFGVAEASYRKTIELEPERADGYRALAQFYLLMQRQFPEAKTLARKALDLSPTAPVYALLGDLCELTDDSSGAEAAMQQAMRLDPTNAAYRRRYEALQKRDEN